MRVLLVTAALLLGAAMPASAATKTWNGGAATQQFNDAGNWEPNGVPGAGDTVWLKEAADVVRLEDGADPAIDRLVYTAGSFTIGGRTLSIGGDSRIAQTLTVGGGGGIELAGRLTLLGDTPTGPGGALTVASGSELAGGTLRLAHDAATVTVEDGASFAPALVELDAGDLVLDADGGLDALEQTGGAVRGSGEIAVGRLTWTGGEQSGPGTTALAPTAPEPVLSGAKQLLHAPARARPRLGRQPRHTRGRPRRCAENAATLTLADDAAIEDAGGALRNLGRCASWEPRASTCPRSRTRPAPR